MMDAKPNILWICTDQQRYDTIHALGNKAIRTPNLDRLAAEGIAFRQAYAQSPVCTPSRASFLTGYHPSRIHVNRNGNAYFPKSARLVTKTLADIGYDCGLVGKLHLSAADGRVEPRPDDGYRVFKWSHHPKPEPFWPIEAHAYQKWLADQGVDWEREYGGHVVEGWDLQSEFQPGIRTAWHQTTWCFNEAIAFLQEAREGPWLCSINPFDPHPPFDPPPEYMERMDVARMPLPLWRESDLSLQRAFRGIDHQTLEPVPPDSYEARRMVAAYYAQIELIDDQVGRLLDALEASGQRENTLVIFHSDHGEMLGDHGLRLKGCRFYEGAVHIPLIISWPGRIVQGVVSDALVELTDLTPTILEALGLPIPADMQGISLWPILSGIKDPSNHRPFVRCEYHDALARPHASHANMIYDGRYKLCVYHGHEIGELYDLSSDPQEFHNLWHETSAQPIKQRLLKLLFDAIMLDTDPGQPRVGRY